VFERSDSTLVKQALNGKKSAWSALVKRYEKNLYNYTLRMVSNNADAMDLMQDIFVAVLRNLATFRGDSPFKNWLFSIAHYRCIEFYRRKKPNQSLDELPEQHNEELQGCPEFIMLSGQQAQALHQAMQLLPFNQKMIVEMKFFQQFTFDDIGKQLGISTNTVKSRLYSALDKLKNQLGAEHV
jgi:RNA polymerase sigma-70 factor, ECF subfamily